MRHRLLLLSIFVIVALPACDRARGTPHDVAPTGRATSDPVRLARDDARAERPYSVQLHVHGSFSEGIGSIDSHSHEASEVAVDVIWWSDHDFRIATYGHASTFGFEDWTEPMPPQPETTQHRRRRLARKRLEPAARNASLRGEAELVTGDAREGERSLRLRLVGASPAFETYRFTLAADRNLFKRPLASEVTLLLSVFPEEIGPDARIAIDVGLSEHPPRAGLPLAPYHLRYLLDPQGGEPARDGITFVVPVAVRPGEWNDLALPVSRDAVRGFSFIHGEDNSLANVSIAVEARGGHEVRARFDDFRIEQELSGPAAFARQASLIDAVARDYPSVKQLQGVEISWMSSHLNEFSVDTKLLDYDALRAEAKASSAPGDEGKSLRERLTRRAVEQVHARGGLVSYNHMFGAMQPGATAKLTREEVLENLLANRVFGADILEVGYRERGGRILDDHLWVWDRLAEHGLFLVGTGVSDTHGGPRQRWRTSENNFVSWIYARSPAKADLLEGLRAGRVYFGDRVLFDGTLDLTAGRGARMGRIVLSDRPNDEVRVTIDGLDPGDVVHVIASGETVASSAVPGSRYDERFSVTLADALPTTVRIRVDGADGGVKVLSNPITFVRSAPPAGLPAARAALDVGGIASWKIERFTVTGARALGRDAGVEIRGRGDSGRLELVCASAADEASVELEGLSGTWSREAPGLVVSGLTGDGTILVRGC